MADEQCPVCARPIPAQDRERHAAGLDHRRLECGLQDIERIRAAYGETLALDRGPRLSDLNGGFP